MPRINADERRALMGGAGGCLWRRSAGLTHWSFVPRHVFQKTPDPRQFVVAIPDNANVRCV